MEISAHLKFTKENNIYQQSLKKEDILWIWPLDYMQDKEFMFKDWSEKIISKCV